MQESKRRKKDTPQPVEMEIVEPAMSDDEDELMLSDDEGTRIDGIYIPPAQKPTLSLDPTGPRLIITKIDNNFFKSYANDQVLGPFHKCFNAIVGPNGSGKSNVIDSLLFVFGYRATKIRCKKVSVLLHNSGKFRNVQSCTVAIHFAEIIDKEGSNYEIVPGSQFVVSRTANKDNSSYYELNGRRVQFKEVGVILKNHGIDLDHNRFLILQGEVEQIAMMKCKADKDGDTGMLEYLEDIVGTSRYKKPLEQVYERVEVLAEQRTEKLNRLKMVEDEMNELREPMEEAVGFLKTENTLVKSKSILYQKSIKDVREKLEVEQKSREEVSEVQKYYKDKLKELNEQKEQYLETQDKEARIYENLKKKKDSIKEAFDKANKKDIQLQEDMTNKNKTRKKTKEQIAEEKKKLSKLEKVPEENEKNVKEIEGQLEQKIAEKERYEAEKSVMLQNIQRETKGLQAQKEEMQKDLAVLKEAVDKTKSAFNLAETELKVCISNEENEKNKLEQLTNLYETSKVTIEERSRQVAELNKKIPATRKALDEANVELLQVRQEETNTVNMIRNKRAALEEGRSSMQASRSSGRVLDSLMRAKKEGKCPGLFGRLGDLGAIDAKYDVAISTACGPLDNIVVDTVDCAQWCIEFLKKHDIGRGVFIALDKQQHLWHQANSQIQTPENVPRLYDLVRIQDERVKTAFYYALRDTLVANDLDQASRIAYGARRYRVVTLKGDLIETTGTMSGGGKRQQRGRMGQSVAVSNIDPRELKRLEEEVQTMELRVRELRQRQATLETNVADLQPALRQMQIDLEKYNQELQSLKQQQPNLARQIKAQEVRAKTTKADAGQVKKLTAIVEEKKEEYDAASETAGALQVKVDKLTKEIKDKSTGKLRTVEKKIKDCTKTIDLCKSEITRLKVAVKTAQRNYKTTKENIARMEQDVEDMENSLRAMKEQREEIEVDAKKLLTCVEEITEQLEERENTFQEARKVVDKIVKEETKLKSEKIDVDEKLKGHDKKVREYKATIQSWESKMNQLKLQEIPNEPLEELKDFTDEELDEMDVETVEKEMKAAESHLKAAKPNLAAIQEYRKQQVVFDTRTKELEEITNKRAEMRKVFDDLRDRRKTEFIIGYNIIKLKLKEMYQMITLGGDADFEMVDTYDPFTEGIQFNVRPPRKTWKKISNLSGGEKTLSSLALVFALHYYKPSPLYVMDEIDAALDFKNVSIVGNYIKERTKNAQFIIISLRSNMFELCDNLVGIYKTYDTTKTITINPTLYDAPPAPSSVSVPSGIPAPLQDNLVSQPERTSDNVVSRVNIQQNDIAERISNNAETMEVVQESRMPEVNQDNQEPADQSNLNNSGGLVPHPERTSDDTDNRVTEQQNNSANTENMEVIQEVNHDNQEPAGQANLSTSDDLVSDSEGTSSDLVNRVTVQQNDIAERLSVDTENMEVVQEVNQDNQEPAGRNDSSLNDSGESGMATTDSHMDDEESIPETPNESSSSEMELDT